MKIQTKDIEFNPFRNLTLIPIDKITVDLIKESIETVGLWSGMEARPKNNDWQSGKYEIPFGHHRLIAIRELNIKELDIPVHEIPDSNMVLMMVKENMTQRGLSTEMINGTVEEVKCYLDTELAKYETWGLSNKVIKQLCETEAVWRNTKSKGVGQTTILKFLGKSIQQYKIQAALDNIKSKDIDREATEVFEKINVANEFKTAIRSINKDNRKTGKPEIDIDQQKGLAEKVKERIKSNGKKGISSGGGSTYRKSLKNIILQEIGGTDEFETELNDILNEITVIESDAKKLSGRIRVLNTKIHELGVENIKTFNSIILTDSFAGLFSSSNTLANYLGFQFNNIKVETNENQLQLEAN